MRLRLHLRSIRTFFSVSNVTPVGVAAICLVILIVGLTQYQRSKFQATKGAAPVGYWKLDEGVGSQIYDSAGTNHGSIGNGNSSPLWKTQDECVTGSCLWFDGTNDKIGITSVAAIATNTVTVSFWMRSPNNFIGSGWNVVMGKGDGATGWYIQRYSNTNDISMRVDTSASNNQYGKGLISLVFDNKWHYITYVINHANSEIKAYKDGVLIKTHNYLSGNGVGSTAPFEMGNTTAVSSFMKGYIDDVKLYDYERSADQINKDYVKGGSIYGTSATLSSDSKQFLSDGLVGYWNMNEGVGTSVADYSGNGGRSSAFSGNTTWTTGKYGSGLTFDGSDDVVRIPENTAVDLGSLSDSYTVSAWFKTSTNFGTAVVIVQKFGLGSYIPFTLRMDTNERIGFSILDYSHSPSVYSTQTYADGAWHHAVGVRDVKNKKLYLYIDGKLAAVPVTDTTDTTMVNDSDISIGNGTGASYDQADFNGQIDEVRIYNRALNEAEVKKLYTVSPGPVAYYPINEGVGTTIIYDHSGNGYNLYMGDGMTPPQWVHGKYGKTLHFRGDGTADQLYSTTWINNLPMTDMSVGYWMYWEDNGQDLADVPIGKRGISNVAWYMTLNEVNQSLEIEMNYDGTDAFYRTSFGVVPYNQWVYVYVTWDATLKVAHIYLNGVETTYSAQTPATGNYVDDSANVFRIADDNETFQVFPGMIDDVRIYNYFRSHSQIIEDMNGGHPVGGSPVGSQVGYFKFDEGKGDSVYDDSPLDLTGDLSGSTNCPATTTVCPQWTNNGKYGKALYFGGLQTANGDSHVRLATNGYDTLTEGALSFWMKADNAGDANQNIFGVAEDDNNGFSDTFSIQYTVGGALTFGAINNGSLVLAAGTVPYANPTSWHHVVFNMGSSGNELYIDGVKKNVTYTTGSASTSVWFSDISENLTAYTIGCNDADGSDDNDCDDTELFQGYLDEFKIYSTPLTADQVKSEYNQGKSLVLGSTSTQADGTTPSNGSDRSYCVPGDTSTCSPPIGEWTFNEGTGSTAFDTSGNAYDAGKFNNFDFNADDGWKKGKFGKAIQLDGVNDNVQVASTAFSLVGSGSFSISTWVKFDTLSTVFHRILTYRQDASNGYHLAMAATNDGTCPQRLLFEVVKAGTYYAAGCSSSNPTYTTGVWYHVEAIFDGGTNTSTLYVNGIKQAGTTLNSLGLGVSNTLTFGSQSSAGTNLMDGYIDDTRIYDYARTAAQVSWEYNKGKPVAWYPLDECSGSSIYDWSDNGDIGTTGNTGALSLGANGVTTAGTCGGSGAWGAGGTGPSTNSLGFDASDDYVSVPSTTKNDITSQITLTAWVNPKGYPGGCGAAPRGGIISKGGMDTNTGYELLYNGNVADNYPLEFNIPMKGTLSVLNPFTFDTWYHLAATSDGTNAKIYINGKVRASSSSFTGTPLDSSAYILNIGRREPANNYDCTFNGKLDDVRIYNYALTEKQIQTVYNNGAVSFR